MPGKIARFMQVLAAVAVGALVAGGGFATAAALIGSDDVQNNSLRSRDVMDGTLRCKDLREQLCSLVKAAGQKGDPGAKGDPGTKGDKGDKGDSGETRITSLPSGGFEATNASVSHTPDGVEFGPYADGSAEGGSLYYTGLNGQPLSAVKSLLYKARYTSDGDTGGVAVPYLRIFLEGDAHDVIFAPNTQPPDSDASEGPFHLWAATSGLWRYDDDGGSGGEYGVNGAPFMEVVGDHGTETISGIYITTGFSDGDNLAALLRSVEINGQRKVFG
jgi:hypothetical protein